jgi:hypothetical protein
LWWIIGEEVPKVLQVPKVEKRSFYATFFLLFRAELDWMNNKEVHWLS